MHVLIVIAHSAAGTIDFCKKNLAGRQVKISGYVFRDFSQFFYWSSIMWHDS